MKDKIKEELLDELLKDYKSPEDLIGPEGLLTELKKRLINKELDAELTTHLGYASIRRRRPPMRTPATGTARRRCAAMRES